MPTRDEYAARQDALKAKFDEFYKQVKNLPEFESAGIGFIKLGDFSLENMGFVVQLHRDADLDAVLRANAVPSRFQNEPVAVRLAPDPKPEGSGTRPIVGGLQTAVGKSSYGTLGGIAKRNSNGKAILLSNNHVFYGNGAKDGSTVYQPSPSCCDSYAVGTNVLGIDGSVDAAIAEASVSVTNAISGIGTVVGIATAVCGEILQKTGAKTGTTKGVVTNVTLAPKMKTAITALGAPGYSAFTQPGDSGSLYVNKDLRVVGLHNSGDTIDGIKYSYGADINNVVATMGITIPNPDVAAADADMSAFLVDPPPPPDFSKYEKELNESVNGRAGLQVIKQYAAEVQQLVHHDRAVTVVWLDNKGPQFGTAWQAAESNPALKLPKTVDGVTLDALLNNMADILVKRGNPGLAGAIQTYRSATLAAATKLDSVNDLRDFVNGDAIRCFAVNFLWSLIWDAGTPFYLPTVAQKGLYDPGLGIDIKPFATIKVGDIPEITMFDEPVLGYMKLAMTGTQVSGIETVTAGKMECIDNADGSATLNLSLNFAQLVFSGLYTVTAGGGVGGCAIAGAAAILGGLGAEGDLAAMGDPVRANIDEALWYREPLGKSANGRTLIGGYYANQDAVLDLQQESGGDNTFTHSLRAATVKSTTVEVNKATTYYQRQQLNLLGENEAAEPAPTIGEASQYDSGQLPYAYLIALARRKVRDGKDPDGRFARMAEAATSFVGSIAWYRNTYPDPQPVGGADGVLERIAKADPIAVQNFVLKLPPVPVRDPETGAIVEHLAHKPADIRSAQLAYNRFVANSAAAAAGSSVQGKFHDAGIDIAIQASVTLSGNMKADPLAVVDKLLVSIGEIKITLESTGGWWPGLFDKVTNWIANNKFFLDILKDQIQKQIDGPTVRNALGNLLTGAMKNLG